MNIKKLFFLASIAICNVSPLNAYAVITEHSASVNPHFYVRMENKSNQDAFISFKPVVGNVSLLPVLNSHTPLLTHEQSQKYGVVFNPLGRNDTFDIIFTGKQDCSFNIAFYAQNNPKVTISGPGCFGGGYRVNKDTLELYISDIHL